MNAITGAKEPEVVVDLHAHRELWEGEIHIINKREERRIVSHSIGRLHVSNGVWVAKKMDRLTCNDRQENLPPMSGSN